IDFGIIPAAVFTTPEVATVGLSEEAAEAQGIPYSTHKAFYRANGKALAMGADEGLAKFLTDADGKIIGCHILGEHAADLIHEAATLMKSGATLHTLADSIHAHPSLSEILLNAAE
ncbi:MAG: dihydrolipoyl dehydrogenase, partial [Bacteroidaceae bacterium]|nr:dihydrolipoyl dehydrogenase [Bacteroidaceae bacterium]